LENSEALDIKNKPRLRAPYMICGIDGWLNSGDVSTGGVQYLIKQFQAIKFAEMDTARYHIYQISGEEGIRLPFKMEDGLIVETHFPKNEFYYATNPNSDHDLIFLLGTEPNLHWEEYTNTVVSLAKDLGAVRLHTMGGIMDRTPYTRWPRITCTCTGPKVKEEMEQYNIIFSTREGSASFNLMMLYSCMQQRLDGVNLTVRVPYYPEFNIGMQYCPKSTRAILIRYNHLMQLGVNFEELDTTIQELDGKLDFVRQQNPQFNTYIEELEKNYEELPYNEPLNISANEAVRLAEEFLKNNKDKPSGNGH
jgi:proteasome assembly chaperone (PAC2) family protein